MVVYPFSTSSFTSCGSDKAEFGTYQDRFFADPSGKLTELLEFVFESIDGLPRAD